jgi:hypothetical protein
MPNCRRSREMQSLLPNMQTAMKLSPKLPLALKGWSILSDQNSKHLKTETVDLSFQSKKLDS